VTGAWLTGEEDHKGPLQLGYVADLAVLDRDYFGCAEDEIKDIQVVMTVCDGRVVWERERADFGDESRRSLPSMNPSPAAHAR